MYKQRITWLLTLILLLALLVAGCGQASSNSSSTSRDVSIDQALTDWQSKSALIIDVRTPGEYAESHIPGSKLISLDKLSSRLSEIPKEGKVYIICRSGNRSSQATSLLRDKGFDNVYNITSGIPKWKGPLE